MPPPPEEGDEPEQVLLPTPKMSITVESTEVLQLTISKTCLDVLSKLGKAFGDAYNLVEVVEKPGELESPYVMRNDTGRNIKLKLDEAFRVRQEKYLFCKL